MTMPSDAPAQRAAGAGGLPAPVRAALWYVAALSLWGASAGLVRYAAAEIPPIELGFLRALFGALLMVPWLVHARVSPLPRRHLGVYLLRGVIEVAAIARAARRQRPGRGLSPRARRSRGQAQHPLQVLSGAARHTAWIRRHRTT
jgi:hypothetical protein